MSFWGDKIAQAIPEPLRPAEPGAWWQQKRASSRIPASAATPGSPPRSAAVSVYAPAEAESTEKTERCPRCGSGNYAEVMLDLSYGGRMPANKQCFDCRYPAFNASGDLVRTKGIRMSGTADAKTMKVRQTRGANWGSWNGFDSAVNIDHLVS